MNSEELIIKGKGAATRKSLILATGLLLLQTVLNYFVQIAMAGKVDAMLACQPLFTGLVGALLIAIGELRYGRRPADEREELNKAGFYLKALTVFIDSVACTFCIVCALNYHWWKGYEWDDSTYSIFVSYGYGYTNASWALYIILGACFIYLLLQYKKMGVSLYTDAEVEAQDNTWKKVLLNILKFAGKCLLFILIGSSIVLFSLRDVSIIGGMDIMGKAGIKEVAYGGICIFFVISLEYLLYAFLEHFSKRAYAKNKVSKITLVLFLIFFVARAIDTILSGWPWPNRNVEWAKWQSFFNYYCTRIAFICLGLCIVYSLSQLRNRTDERVLKGVYNLGLIKVIMGLVSILAMMAAGTTSLYAFSVRDDSAKMYALLDTVKYYYIVEMIAYEIVMLIFLIRLFSSLRESGLIANKAFLIPVFGFVANMVYIIVVDYFAHSETMLAFSIIKVLVMGLYIPFICMISKKLQND